MYTLYWIVKKVLRKLEPFEERIVSNCFGWVAPEMMPHWRRLLSFSPTDFFHAAVNIRVEWTRLDPQRAAKNEY